MSKIGVVGLPNKFKGHMDGVSYDLDGRLFLTRDNLIEWGDLVGVDDQGGPTGIGSLLFPFFPTGFNIYAGFSLGNMIRQNASPLPLDQRHVFMLPGLVTEGHSPPSESEAALTQQPYSPLLTVSANTQAGFAANTYRIAFTGIDEGGRHTLVSPEASVVVASGRMINLTIPEWARGYSALGVWMSQPQWFSQSPLYLQDIIEFSQGFPETYALTGPFTAVKTAPSVNETYLGRASNPIATRGVASSFDLFAGTYPIHATLVTKTGESLANQTPVTVTEPVDRAKSTIAVAPSSKPAGVVGWKCYVKLADGKTYLVYPSSSTPEKPLLLSQKAELYSTDPGRWGHSSWAVSQKDLPLVDTSGLPKPDIAPYEMTTSLPASIPSGSVVHVMTTLTDGDQEGPRSSPSSISVSSASQMITGTLPKSTQLIPNAEGLETDSNGLPLRWVLRQTATVNGTASAIEGQFNIATTGSITTESASVWVQPTRFDRTVDSKFVAQIGVSGYVSGRVEIALLEYSTLTPSYPTTTPLRTTIIDTLSGDGEKDIEYAIPSTFWHANALSIALVYRITDINGVTGSGGARQLASTMKHAGLFPHEHAPRKWADPLRGVAALAESTVSSLFSFIEGALARIGFPPISLIPPISTPWNKVNRPLTTGTIEEELTFESGALPSGWTVVKEIGGTASSDPGITVDVRAAAAIQGSFGLFCKDTSTSGLVGAGIRKALLNFPRHRAGLGAFVRTGVRGAAGRRYLLRILSSANLSLGRIAEDQSGHVYLEYRSGGTLFSRRIMTSVPLNSVMDLDLTVSGAGTNKGIVSAWGVLGTSGTRVLLGRFERLDLVGHTADFVQVGADESVATDTWEHHFDRVRVSDGGQKWYRDHNANGELLGQAHLFMPSNASSTQNAFLKNIEVAVKPGQRYGLGAFAEYVGARGTSYPMQITLQRLNGETIPMGTIFSPTGTGGVTGTAAWQEYLRDITIPAHNPLAPEQSIYKINIDSRDIGVGAYTLQEIGMSELTTTETLAVKRTGRGTQSGVYVATLDTETPRKPETAPRLPKRWIRAAADIESLPTGTTVDVRLRTTGDLISYSGYASTLEELTKNRYLEFELAFDAISIGGRDTPIISPESPVLEARFWDTVMLREDGSEFPGGVLVNQFTGAYDDPQYEVLQRHSGRNYRAPIAEPVPWTDGFTFMLFTKEAMDEIKETWPKVLFLIESEQVGESAKIMVLEKPTFDVRTDLFELDGDVYRTYATGEIGECEVSERLVPPGL